MRNSSITSCSAYGHMRAGDSSSGKFSSSAHIFSRWPGWRHRDLSYISV